MIKLNWMIILTIIVLLVFLYMNNSEHFAGTISPANLEAISNISSMANSGNLSLSNITTTSKLQSDGITVFKNGTHFPWSDGKNYIRGQTQVDGNVNFNNEITVNDINIPGAYISKSDKSPNALNITYGDGSGWRINFKKWDGNTFASLYDNGTFCLGNTCINENELKNLKTAARRIYTDASSNDIIELQGMKVPLDCHGYKLKNLIGGCNLWEAGRFDSY